MLNVSFLLNLQKLINNQVDLLNIIKIYYIIFLIYLESVCENAILINVDDFVSKYLYGFFSASILLGCAFKLYITNYGTVSFFIFSATANVLINFIRI